MRTTPPDLQGELHQKFSREDADRTLKSTQNLKSSEVGVVGPPLPILPWHLLRHFQQM